MSNDGVGALIGAFALNKVETVAAYVTHFRGKNYVHIRVLVPSIEDDSEWVPTQKGVAVEVGLFPELQRIILKLWNVTGNVETGRIEKGSKDAIVVGLNAFRDNYYCQVRNYFKNAAGDWLPTKKGIAIPTSKLQDLDELLEQVAEALSNSEEDPPPTIKS